MLLQILHANNIQRLLARRVQMHLRHHALVGLVALLVSVVQYFFPARGAETPFAACC